MRRTWASEVASFYGEFVRFEAIRLYPKPVGGRAIPVIVGGTTDAALRRVASIGDGWYGFNLAADEVPERLSVLAQECRERGRDVRHLSVAVALSDGDPALLPELAAAGVTELVVVAEPPAEPRAAADWVDQLAARWLGGSKR
jgi:alkanesulfonate monooxygenase SsuD/methylene tetrahydromethanopterin reductase-like flavin-dependent oxidoreductase (luciferase family)